MLVHEFQQNHFLSLPENWNALNFQLRECAKRCTEFTGRWNLMHFYIFADKLAQELKNNEKWINNYYFTIHFGKICNQFEWKFFQFIILQRATMYCEAFKHHVESICQIINSQSERSLKLNLLTYLIIKICDLEIRIFLHPRSDSLLD